MSVIVMDMYTAIDIVSDSEDYTVDGNLLGAVYQHSIWCFLINNM